ncbi:CDP-glycerol glycerophosphotransferase family protein [Providencia alcalifaciens]|uniref:CDP-glycerol glycerophosphotransferase family protein n=1 Tax=Providencia TaxID=586 RepID=UPI0015D0BDE1|nr:MULTISPECIES: CDP-glycerol glycerophosphotransferase family protein [Providencia]MBF0692607.1 CDP-glycerol glycerophosphotransferase family protein [Providencia alcalifaciens]NYS91111.1 CDP-glycerol glycerophosphotransferase family protein [Providencia alcalifaciens]
MLKNITLLLIKILNAISIKKNIILFYSTPDLSDNALAYYYHIKENKKWRCIWVIKDIEYTKKVMLSEEIKNLEYIKINSIKEIYYSLISKIHINTHGSGYKKFKLSKFPIVVSLWHGSPIKKIGRDINETICQQDILISGADYFIPFMQSSIASSSCEIITTGLPRNDWITKNLSSTTIIDKKNMKDFIIWMPTFFKSKNSSSREKSFNDGEINDGYISFLPLSRFKELNSVLSQLELIIYIKLHPYDILNDWDFSSFNCENIKVIKYDDFNFIGSKLYSMLSSSSGLISDVSSVIFDYVYTSKPIGIDTYSSQKYLRPLYFSIQESELNTFKINNFDSLFNFLHYVRENEHKKTKSIYAHYSDTTFCSNVEKIINEKF